MPSLNQVLQAGINPNSITPIKYDVSGLNNNCALFGFIRGHLLDGINNPALRTSFLDHIQQMGITSPTLNTMLTDYKNAVESNDPSKLKNFFDTYFEAKDVNSGIIALGDQALLPIAQYYRAELKGQVRTFIETQINLAIDARRNNTSIPQPLAIFLKNVYGGPLSENAKIEALELARTMIFEQFDTDNQEIDARNINLLYALTGKQDLISLTKNNNESQDPLFNTEFLIADQHLQPINITTKAILSLENNHYQIELPKELAQNLYNRTTPVIGAAESTPDQILQELRQHAQQQAETKNNNLKASNVRARAKIFSPQQAAQRQQPTATNHQDTIMILGSNIVDMAQMLMKLCTPRDKVNTNEYYYKKIDENTISYKSKKNSEEDDPTIVTFTTTLQGPNQHCTATYDTQNELLAIKTIIGAASRMEIETKQAYSISEPLITDLNQARNYLNAVLQFCVAKEGPKLTNDKEFENLLKNSGELAKILQKHDIEILSPTSNFVNLINQYLNDPADDSNIGLNQKTKEEFKKYFNMAPDPNTRKGNTGMLARLNSPSKYLH